MTKPTPKLTRLLSRIEHDSVREILTAARKGALVDGSIEVVAAYICELEAAAAENVYDGWFDHG